jgi:small subunit ribosomal protein S18
MKNKGPRGRRKRCALCAEGLDEVDYKRVSLLRRYISERATMLPRRRTGTCAKHQRKLATAIKRARLMALLPMAPHHRVS